jgi:hypothetical protein
VHICLFDRNRCCRLLLFQPCLQRTWEALAAGALVFVDQMLVPAHMPHPLVHKEHLIFYDLDDNEGVGVNACSVLVPQFRDRM